MANERDDEKFAETEGKSDQSQSTGQQKQQSETGQQGEQSPGGESSTGQTQPSGGADALTSEASTSSDKSDTGGAEPIKGEGFIGSQSTGSDEFVREDGAAGGETGAASADTTGGKDFAEKGQGATDETKED